jgi:hypothetical protein
MTILCFSAFVLRAHKFQYCIRIKSFTLLSCRMWCHVVCTSVPTFLENLLPLASSELWVLLSIRYHKNMKSKYFQFCNPISISQHIISNSSALPHFCPMIHEPSSGSYISCHTEMSFLHTFYYTEAVYRGPMDCYFPHLHWILILLSPASTSGLAILCTWMSLVITAWWLC